MPQRRPHKKSRNGCEQCRKRRVKCDENPPRCANCTARNEECHFRRPLPQNHSNLTTSPDDLSSTLHASPNASLVSSSSDGVLQCSDTSRDPERLREIELMHRWCTHTYSGFGPRHERLFKEYVGTEALRHDYLLSALLALSAIHVASDAVDNDFATASQYVSIGLQYQNEALSGLRRVLPNIDGSNCSAILFATSLIMLSAIVSPLLPVGPYESTQSTAEAILPLVDYMNAIKSIVMVGKEYLADTNIKNYLDDEKESVKLHGPVFIEELHRLNDTAFTAEDHAIFHRAIVALLKVSHDGDGIMEWLVNVGPNFLCKLRNRESMALAIYMHWGAQLDQLEQLWWAKFSGKRLVDELSTTLRTRGPEWNEITAWCRKRVGLPDETNGCVVGVKS